MNKNMALVGQLARDYVKDVKLRKELGDSHAEYHAQQPKVEAYRILLDEGYTVKEAIAIFNRIAEEGSQD